MKINTRNLSYEEVLNLPRLQHKNPRKPSRLLATVVRVASLPTLWKTKFSYTTERMEELPKDEPCLILMNHSCFLDMQIAYRTFYPSAFNIIATTDSFVSFGGLMGWLMRTIGCVPVMPQPSPL